MEKAEVVLGLMTAEKKYLDMLKVYEEATVAYRNLTLKQKDFDAICEKTINCSIGYQNALIIARRSGYFNCPTCKARITSDNILVTFTTDDFPACQTCYDPTPKYSEGE